MLRSHLGDLQGLLEGHFLRHRLHQFVLEPGDLLRCQSRPVIPENRQYHLPPFLSKDPTLSPVQDVETDGDFPDVLHGFHSSFVGFGLQFGRTVQMLLAVGRHRRGGQDLVLVGVATFYGQEYHRTYEGVAKQQDANAF